MSDAPDGRPRAMADQERAAALTRPAVRKLGPVVPPGSIAGRALVAVVAIMCFLACFAVGAVTLALEAARDWQSEVLREVTIQVRPIDGVDTDREVGRAVDLARRAAGIVSVRALTRAENQRLVEPWIGQGFALDALPLPRLIVLEVDRGRAPDLAALARALEDVRGASLDDHRQWRDRLAAMTNAVVVSGFVVLVLVLVATALSVVFATRGAMASNREIVDVLHLVGADDRFIAGEFQRRFMRLGLEGGLIGGVAAIVAFQLVGVATRGLSGAAGARQLDMLVGSLSIGWTGLFGILVTVALVAAVTAGTSRLTVSRYLQGHS
jgi:cell division transport system permease protein